MLSQQDIECSNKEACLNGVLCDRHVKMWKDNYLTPHADAAGAEARLVTHATPKRPHEEQEEMAGEVFSTTSNEDESMGERPYNQDGVMEGALGIYL